jgi:hypothetical protein
MTTAISGVAAGQFQQPQQVAFHAASSASTAPHSTADVVTISAQGKQTVQLRSDGSSPAEEVRESPIEKAVEAQAGKK